MAARAKIFLSSPGDVEPERLAVRRAVDRINATNPEDHLFDLFRWEEHFYTSDSTFQDQVVKPSDCDLVICLFWKRLGTELPPDYARPDGTLPTGTEYEFEEALAAAAAADPKTPDLLVYRKMAPVTFTEESLEFEKAQRDRFLQFWRRWFHSEKGHFVAAFHTFEEMAEFEALIENHLRQWLARHEPLKDWTEGPPYRGLRPYDVQHAPIFFGRDRETDRARARLLANVVAGTPVLMVTGPSGSGKSSLLRAGLLARLTQPGGAAPLADEVRYAIVTPSGLWPEGVAAGVSLRLAEALFDDTALGEGLKDGDFDTPEELAELLAAGGDVAAAPILRAMERMADARAADQGRKSTKVAFILVIDQFEEIFRVHPPDAGIFLEVLEKIQARATEETPFILVSSMRSDFQHRLSENPVIARLVGVQDVRGPEDAERLIEIAPPRYADMRSMIMGPARAAGLTFEVDDEEDLSLAEKIEGDANPKALPSLQYLLSELYAGRNGHELSFDVYNRLGGVAGVMATRGEEVLSGLPGEVREALPRVVRALVVPGAEGNGPVSRPVETRVFGEGTPEARLVAALTEASLLSSDRGVVRVAHESLLTDWDRIARQVETEQRYFVARDGLGKLVAAYRAAVAENPRAAGCHLLEGFPLAEGTELLLAWGDEALADYDPDLPVFIRRSIKRARMRRVRGLAAAAGGACLLLGAGFVAFTLQQRADASAREAALQLNLGRAEAALRQRDWDDAVAAALEARGTADTVATRSALLTALMGVSPHLAAVETVARSDADVPVVVQDAGGVVLLADGSVLMGPGVASTSFEDGAPYLIDDGQGALLSGGGSVLVAFADGFEGIWLRRCTAIPAPACTDQRLGEGQATAVALAPDGARLAAAMAEDDAGTVAVFPLGPGLEAPERTLSRGDAGDEILSLAWDAVGGRLAAGTRGGALLLGPVDGEALPQVASQNVPVRLLTWAAGDVLLAHACEENAICLRDPATGDVVRLHGHAQPVRTLVAEEDRLVSTSDDGSRRTWTLAPDGRAMRELTLPAGAQVTALAAAPDGGIYAGASDGRVWHWAGGADHGPRNAIEVPLAGPVADIAADADGRLAVVLDDGGIVVLDGNGGLERLDTPLRGRRVAWVGTDVLAIVSDRAQVALWHPARGIEMLPDAPGRADGVGPVGPDRLATSHTRGGALRLWSLDRAAVGAVPAETVGDALSAFRLSAHPDGRWLTATRGDDRLVVYDLSDGTAPPIAVDLLRPNTKAVAFSPDGARLAALGADGTLYAWDFDAATGALTPVFAVPAVPVSLGEADTRPRAHGLAWIGPARIAVGAETDRVFVVTLDQVAWRARAEALASGG